MMREMHGVVGAFASVVGPTGDRRVIVEDRNDGISLCVDNGGALLSDDEAELVAEQLMNAARRLRERRAKP